ncbi:MAG: hypothetical protein DRJ42_17000 [Deltaproteobacteria bacterium]|nr:MAG: hypothetical protein DRJ42_17000 [Deltaproteobacteria bacterium]
MPVDSDGGGRYTGAMATVNEKLGALAESLAKKGDDGQRLELVQRARRFKRSWVEMAEALSWVRDTRSYERWGYADLHAYCQEELQIRGSTVDKLTGGFATLQQHAPQVLNRDGVAQSIPTVDAVDYFAQALSPSPNAKHPVPEPTEDVIQDLKSAVFDDNKPIAVLRREFNPVLRPKPDGADELERMEKASAAAQRLSSLVGKIDDLSPEVVAKVERTLAKLVAELDELVPVARDRVYPTQIAS